MGPEAKYKLFSVIFAVQSARRNVKQDRNVSSFRLMYSLSCSECHITYYSMCMWCRIQQSIFNRKRCANVWNSTFTV